MPQKRQTSPQTQSKTAPVTPMDFYLEVESEMLEKEEAVIPSIVSPKGGAEANFSEECLKVLNSTVGLFPLGILLLNSEGNVAFANRAALETLDRKESVVLGAPLAPFFGRTSRQTFIKQCAGIWQGAESITIELNLLNSRKKIFPVEFFLTPFTPLHGGKMILLMFRDISKRKEIMALQQEEEKINTLQHFVSGAAQEIHHPIKGVLDRVQGLLTKYQSREFEYISFKEYQDILETLETLHGEMKSCCEITERMISMNKKRVGGRQSHCDPHAVLTDTVKNIKNQFELTKISIRLQKRQSLPNIAMSAVDFDRVMQNILTNALHSMPAGGVIQVKTSLDQEKNRVIVECKDSGVGIPKEDLARVFEPFYTTRHGGEEKSSGLGLSIVYATVKACHGDIDIKSSLRQGTVVTLSLPRYHGRRTRRRTASSRRGGSTDAASTLDESFENLSDTADD